MTNTLAIGHQVSCAGCASDVHTASLTADHRAAEPHTVFADASYVPQVDLTLWNRLVQRITRDVGFRDSIGDVDQQTAVDLAGRILNQTVGFLTLIANNPGVGFSPSPLVDIGWHTFILDTRDYAQFCQQIAGRFIHHSPFDEAGADYGTGHAARTVQVLRSSGWPVDDLLWLSTTCVGATHLRGQNDCGSCEPSRGYDCGSCSSRSRNGFGDRSGPVANNGNCGQQGCSDSCGGPDGFVSDAGHPAFSAIVGNNGNCGSQDNGDGCGGAQDGDSDAN